MPTPPLPETPCIRARLIYNQESAKTAGNRLYFSYAGSAPAAADCTTLATDIAAAWSTHMASITYDGNSLNEVDVQDIATDSGAFGTWDGDDSGTRSGAFVPDNCAFNVEFDLSRRYRGGKPRVFLPAGVQGDLLDQSKWSVTFQGLVETAWSAFIAEIEALSVGAVGALAHVNISYYKGFTNFTQPSGREKAVSKYRDTALVDTVVGYSYKQVVGSQRRRRTSTTP
jgi:hypothetical protein